ncbi:MAG TPA: hypothetical protein ENG35_07315, partial [Desulfobacteraceae bacterium]|nr:hypothetical protein [Desulfobacteraceae bacterium]
MAIFLNFCACLRRGRGRQAQTGQAKILILKICGCIPAVKIFAFLDLAKNFSFRTASWLYVSSSQGDEMSTERLFDAVFDGRLLPDIPLEKAIDGLAGLPRRQPDDIAH